MRDAQPGKHWFTSGRLLGASRRIGGAVPSNAVGWGVSSAVPLDVDARFFCVMGMYAAMHTWFGNGALVCGCETVRGSSMAVHRRAESIGVQRPVSDVPPIPHVIVPA